MHEILLFSQISPSRHNQVLNVLAGVTGSQPFAYQDQNALFAQLRTPEIAASKKKAQTGTPQPGNLQQQQQKWMHKLTRSVQITADVTPEATESWRQRVEQTPDPSIKDHIAREVTEKDLLDTKEYKDASAYRYVGQHYILGHRFVKGNVVVRIFRVLLTQQQLPVDKVLDGPPLSITELQVLDASGTYLVEVSVRMADRKNTAIASQAIAELESFKKNVEGVIDLRVPDRLALDTRVRDA